MNHMPYRKSPRLRNYDYSTAGAYFITICTHQKQCILSRISSPSAVGEGLAPPVLQLLPFGQIADMQLQALESRFPTIHIEKYVIMPNHIHILLLLNTPAAASGACKAPSISTIIGAFKSLTTRQCKINEPLFQRSFHDHIIRTERDYLMIWDYINNNPMKWSEDRFYCANPY